MFGIFKFQLTIPIKIGIVYFTISFTDTCTSEIFVLQNIFPDIFLISGLSSFARFLFRSNMDANFSGKQEKARTAKKVIEPPKGGKGEN